MPCERFTVAVLCGLVSVGLTGCQEDPSRAFPPAHAVAQGQRSPPPPAGPPGDVTLSGRVLSFPTGGPTDAGLCLSLMDPSDRALDGEATVVASATTTAGGEFSLTGLPVAPSVGWILVVDDCSDTSTWVPTGTILPGELVGGRGSGDPVTNVNAWLFATADRDRIDSDLVSSGSDSILGDGGGLLGRSLNSAGQPNHESWVRGPNATQLWYPQRDGTYTLYDHTDSEAGGFYVAPDAEDVYGVFVTRVSGLQFRPLMAGGLPGVIQIWDFVSEEPQVAGAL